MSKPERPRLSVRAFARARSVGGVVYGKGKDCSLEYMGLVTAV